MVVVVAVVAVVVVAAVAVISGGCRGDGAGRYGWLRRWWSSV